MDSLLIYGNELITSYLREVAMLVCKCEDALLFHYRLYIAPLLGSVLIYFLPTASVLLFISHIVLSFSFLHKHFRYYLQCNS